MLPVIARAQLTAPSDSSTPRDRSRCCITLSLPCKQYLWYLVCNGLWVLAHWGRRRACPSILQPPCRKPCCFCTYSAGVIVVGLILTILALFFCLEDVFCSCCLCLAICRAYIFASVTAVADFSIFVVCSYCVFFPRYFCLVWPTLCIRHTER